MKIHFMSPCPLAESQMQRLDLLISQRICLLLGSRKAEHIANVVFSHNAEVKTEGVLIGKTVDRQRKISNIDIIISYDILSAMMHPGKGQAIFDEAILRSLNMATEV